MALSARVCFEEQLPTVDNTLRFRCVAFFNTFPRPLQKKSHTSQLKSNNIFLVGANEILFLPRLVTHRYAMTQLPWVYKFLIIIIINSANVDAHQVRSNELYLVLRFQILVFLLKYKLFQFLLL